MILNLFRSDSSGVHISYGTVVNELKEVSKSYKEARMALDVGKIFFEEQNIIAYSQLGIGKTNISVAYTTLQNVHKGDL